MTVFATFGWCSHFSRAWQHSIKKCCKVTENIWNTQGFQQENANSFVFCAAKPCYLHKCADVISRWDGYAVSVPSTLHQIFNFFDICKREGNFYAFCLSLFSRSSLGFRSVMGVTVGLSVLSTRGSFCNAPKRQYKTAKRTNTSHLLWCMSWSLY